MFIKQLVDIMQSFTNHRFIRSVILAFLFNIIFSEYTIAHTPTIDNIQAILSLLIKIQNEEQKKSKGNRIRIKYPIETSKEVTLLEFALPAVKTLTQCKSILGGGKKIGQKNTEGYNTIISVLEKTEFKDKLPSE
jgi:hypothetical protein